jgi:hypothetical protein
MLGPVTWRGLRHAARGLAYAALICCGLGLSLWIVFVVATVLLRTTR